MRSSAGQKRLGTVTIDINQIVARNIRHERMRLGLSQERLAEICGYHRTYVGSVERGERNITLSTLVSLATGLQTTAIALLGDDD